MGTDARTTVRTITISLDEDTYEIISGAARRCRLSVECFVEYANLT